MFLSEIAVSLLVRLWVEMMMNQSKENQSGSASLWGCELKWSQRFLRLQLIIVSLLVRLWVEITDKGVAMRRDTCQPPCEAVSWNSLQELRRYSGSRQPPCEAVSWNSYGIVIHSQQLCQPPCEAVSWNSCSFRHISYDWSSASLWGCELK